MQEVSLSVFFLRDSKSFETFKPGFLNFDSETLTVKDANNAIVATFNREEIKAIYFREIRLVVIPHTGEGVFINLNKDAGSIGLVGQGLRIEMPTYFFKKIISKKNVSDINNIAGWLKYFGYPIQQNGFDPKVIRVMQIGLLVGLPVFFISCLLFIFIVNLLVN